MNATPGKYDVVIGGSGLAGAASAFWLRRAGFRVLVLEAGHIGSGASGIGLGLVNPLISRKGRPVWQAREALEALKEMNVVGRPGILRPARSEEQAHYFAESADMISDLGSWIPPHEGQSSYPFLRVPMGLISVSSGLAVDIRAQLTLWLDQVEIRTNTRIRSWKENAGGVRVELESGEWILTERLLLCTGKSLLSNPATADLHLHGIKGQTIRVRKPGSLPDPLPSLSSAGYVIDELNGYLTIGSTFEHSWDSEEPDDSTAGKLLKIASEILKGIENAEVIETLAAIRVTVPGTRLPMVGPLPESERVWVFTGLGAKGLMMSAYLGRKIPLFFNDLEAIPQGCRVVRRPHKT